MRSHGRGAADCRNSYSRNAEEQRHCMHQVRRRISRCSEAQWRRRLLAQRERLVRQQVARKWHAESVRNEPNSLRTAASIAASTARCR